MIDKIRNEYISKTIYDSSELNYKKMESDYEKAIKDIDIRLNITNEWFKVVFQLELPTLDQSLRKVAL